MTITLKSLVASLAGKSKPNPAQAVWVIDCPDAETGNFAEAIANSTCELEDKFRCDRPGFFLASTVYLAGLVEKFTPDQVVDEWPAVCELIENNLVYLT
jgi:hypothetical protein